MSKHAHNPTYKATKESKTAQFANPKWRPPTKRERRLASRIMDFEGITKKEGYHKPGSLQ